MTKSVPIGNLSHFERERHIVDLFFTNGMGRVCVITPNIFRVQYTRRKEWNYKPFLAIEEKEWKTVALQIKRHPEKLDITTPRLIISLIFRPFSIRVYDHEGHLLHQDHPRTSAAFTSNSVIVNKRCPKGVPFLGLGDQPGTMNRSGSIHRLELTQSTEKELKAHKNPQITYPLFCYQGKDVAVGHFVDSPTMAQIDLRKSQSGDYSISVDNLELDYYVIVGSDLAEVVRNYSVLLGRSTFPPRWSLEITKGIEALPETNAFKKAYRELRSGFLMTSSVLLHPTDKGGISFLDDKPLKMLRGFKRSERIPHLMLEIDQKVNPRTPSTKELKKLIKQGVFIESELDSNIALQTKDGGIYFDAFYKSSRELISKNLKPLVQSGMWGVEVVDAAPPWKHKVLKKVSFRTIQKIIGEDGESTEDLVHTVSAQDVYAYMPNALAESVNHALRDSQPDARPLAVFTSGFAGIQRNAILSLAQPRFEWADIPKFISRMLSLNISGSPLLCVDLYLHTGMDDELLARLVQAMAFVPLLRLRFPKKFNLKKMMQSNRFLTALDQVLKIREDWLPYLYQLTWLSHTEGTPVLHPTIYHFPEWEPAHGMQNQFLLGDSVLVSPVIKKGISSMTIDLPPGEWVDINSFTIHQGDSKLKIDVDETTLPVFLREGTIVPHYDSDCGEMNKSVKVSVFLKPDVSSETYIYDDDGESMRYLKNEYSSIHVRLSSTKKGYVLKIARREGRMNPTWGSYVFCFIRSRLDIQRVVYNRSELEYYPTHEELLQAKTGFHLDDENELLYIKIPFEREGGVIRF